MAFDITTIVAILGAITGTVSIGWNIYNAAWRDRGRLKIRVNPVILFKPDAAFSGPDRLTLLGIKVANVGRRSVSINHICFRYKNGSGLVTLGGFHQRYGDMGRRVNESLVLPKRLQEGESHTFLFPVEVLKEAVSQHAASILPKWSEVTDGTGKNWRCKLSKNNLTFFQPSATKDDKS